MFDCVFINAFISRFWLLYCIVTRVAMAKISDMCEREVKCKGFSFIAFEHIDINIGVCVFVQ